MLNNVITYLLTKRVIQLQLWDTGGMERIASVTSSYYKFAEAAILVFSLDNSSSFHILSQHLLDIVTYAENAKIFLCGNKSDLEGSSPQVTDADIEMFWWVTAYFYLFYYVGTKYLLFIFVIFNLWKIL